MCPVYFEFLFEKRKEKVAMESWREKDEGEKKRKEGKRKMRKNKRKKTRKKRRGDIK